MHCYWLDAEKKAMRQAILVWITEIKNHLQLSVMLQKHSANMLSPQTANLQQVAKWAELPPPPQRLGWGSKLDNAIKQNGLIGTHPVLSFIGMSKTETMLETLLQQHYSGISQNIITQPSKFIQNRFLKEMRMQCFGNVNQIELLPKQRKPSHVAQNTTTSNIWISVQGTPWHGVHFHSNLPQFFSLSLHLYPVWLSILSISGSKPWLQQMLTQ
jgi:hypothetical protein